MSKLNNYMPIVRRGLAALAAGAISLAVALPAAAAPVKFNFWFGLSGDLERVVQTLCKNFNESQTDYEVVCTSQGNYDAALQNMIAAAGHRPGLRCRHRDDDAIGRLLSSRQADGRKRLQDRLE